MRNLFDRHHGAEDPKDRERKRIKSENGRQLKQASEEFIKNLTISKVEAKLIFTTKTNPIRLSTISNESYEAKLTIANGEFRQDATWNQISIILTNPLTEKNDDNRVAQCTMNYSITDEKSLILTPALDVFDKYERSGLGTAFQSANEAMGVAIARALQTYKPIERVVLSNSDGTWGKDKDWTTNQILKLAGWKMRVVVDEQGIKHNVFEKTIELNPSLGKKIGKGIGRAFKRE